MTLIVVQGKENIYACTTYCISSRNYFRITWRTGSGTSVTWPRTLRRPEQEVWRSGSEDLGRWGGRRGRGSPGDELGEWGEGDGGQSPRTETWSCWVREDWAGAGDLQLVELTQSARRRLDELASLGRGERRKLGRSWSGGPPQIHSHLCSCLCLHWCSSHQDQDCQDPRYPVQNQNHCREDQSHVSLLPDQIYHLRNHNQNLWNMNKWDGGHKSEQIMKQWMIILVQTVTDNNDHNSH